MNREIFFPTVKGNRSDANTDTFSVCRSPWRGDIFRPLKTSTVPWPSG